MSIYIGLPVARILQKSSGLQSFNALILLLLALDNFLTDRICYFWFEREAENVDTLQPSQGLRDVVLTSPGIIIMAMARTELGDRRLVRPYLER